MGLLDVKGYDPAFIEDPVHCGEEYITSKIFNSGADMPPGNHPASKTAPDKNFGLSRHPPQAQPSFYPVPINNDM
ncbi:MAG: hypothetical protein Q8M95_02925 [Candidatus Methanoperedens sp.]|nr:hypothetical protein [Candidatus Methanoperedens sp.]